MDGKGHPLPASDEARHDEIPEHLTSATRVSATTIPSASRPGSEAVAPDGETYPTGEARGDASGDV